MAIISDLTPQEYQRSLIHGPDRIWIETNCYVDVLVELIHALGFNPVAGLAFTLSADYECDQWTFFKYPPIDLLNLYGFDLQELNPWDDLAQHTQRQVDAGRPVLVELDSFYLPDTAGSAYQLAHVKSTVAVNEFNLKAQHMGYFHGQGYYHVDGDDFRQLFHLDGSPNPRILPPYIEYVKLRFSAQEMSQKKTLEASLVSLSRQLELLPETNPFVRFSEAFKSDLEWLMEEDLETFHRYSFATLRQYGACFELSATYVEWLSEQGEANLETVCDNYRQIATQAKTLQFQLARAMARKKPLDLSLVDQMGDAWQSATQILTQKYLNG